MSGVVTSFTKANCDSPGMFGIQHEYAMHGTGCAHLGAWWPSLSYQDASCIVFIHGDGWGHAPGWGSMTGVINNNAKFLELAKQLNAAGWVVISIDYPPSGSNMHSIYGSQPGTSGSFRMSGTWDEITPIAAWPEQPGYVAMAVQYIKSNYTGIVGRKLTPFGRRLFGIGNSIDPEKIVLAGHMHGGTLATYAALIPSTLYANEPSLAHDSMDLYGPRASHRVRGVISIDPRIEFGQFHIDPGYTSPAGTIWMNGHDQTFARAEDRRPWDELEQIFKFASPIEALALPYAENESISFFTEWNGVGTGDAAWDANLSYAQWDQDSVRNDTAHGKAWIQPHDGRIQGPAWRAAIREWGKAQGTTSSANIRKSVTRYVDTVGDALPYGSAAEYADKCRGWLGGLGL